MKKISVLALGLLLGLMFTTPVWAGKDDLKNGFLGLSWGASAAKLSNKTQINEAELGQVPDVAAYSVKGVSLGGIKIDEVQYFFFKDQFTQAIMKHNDFQALGEALGKEYGKADMEQPNGMKNWVIMVDMNNNEMVTVGTVPGENVAAAVNTKYFIKMMEAIGQ